MQIKYYIQNKEVSQYEWLTTLEYCLYNSKQCEPTDVWNKDQLVFGELGRLIDLSSFEVGETYFAQVNVEEDNLLGEEEITLEEKQLEELPF